MGYPSNIIIPSKLSEQTRKRRAVSAARRDKEFLRGPIPMPWLKRAASLRGRSPLAVAIALWWMVGITGSNKVKLTQGMLDRVGLNRKAGYRGSKALENAGLIEVGRLSGRRPIVTIKEIGDNARLRGQDPEHGKRFQT